MNNLLAKPTSAILVAVSILIRLIPHPPNFTPLGATSLFGGSKLSRPWNYLAPLFVLFVTDLIIGFHSTMPYVYGAFIISAFIGERFLSRQNSISKLLAIATINSVLFYLITNFGVWASSTLYPQTAAGLAESYLMGLPFLRNTLAADLIFTLGFFKLYEVADQRQIVGQIDSRLTNWLVGSGK